MGHITIRRSGTTATVLIDNPDRRNAMTLAMYDEVPAIVAEAAADDTVRVIVVRGAGDEAFCAGSNVAEFREHRLGDDAEHYARVEHRAFAAIADAPVPTIAAVHGPCMGGGVALAAACDLRIATRSSTFAVPPGRLGVGYPVDGVEALCRLIGMADTKRLIFTAATIDAAEAGRIGLVTEVVDDDALDDRVDTLTATIATLAPLTLRAAKLAAHGDPAAAEAVRVCFASDDYREGIAAFEERRRPVFRGR